MRNEAHFVYTEEMQYFYLLTLQQQMQWLCINDSILNQ